MHRSGRLKRWLRRIHRWLGLLMVVQIVFWMVSGLYFAWFPIETIRGEHLLAELQRPDAGRLEGMVPPWVAWNNVAAGFDTAPGLTDMRIAIREGQPFYRLSGVAGGESFSRLVDGASGRVVPRMDASAAKRRATGHLAGGPVPVAAQWVTVSPPGSEFRGRPLPLWRVSFDTPERVNVYLEPWTGEVLAVRTTRWRVFDFLWMLHIMDFDERDDFNTLLLQGAALLGLLIAVSGLVFWAVTTRLFRRRRPFRATL